MATPNKATVASTLQIERVISPASLGDRDNTKDTRKTITDRTMRMVSVIRANAA